MLQNDHNTGKKELMQLNSSAPDERPDQLTTMKEDNLLSAVKVERSDAATCLLCNTSVSMTADNVSAKCPQDDCIVSAEGTLFASNYLLTRKLGAGGWGSVYKCTDLHLQKTLAIKLLHKHMVRDRNTLLRFQREARILSSLSHPNVVQIEDHGWAPQPFIAMELLEGQPLSTLIEKKGHLVAEEAVPIFLQICGALEAAHQIGVVHRDLKPENVFLTVSGEVKVLDFGVAKLSENTLTATGETFGSPGYMSPEQCMGNPLDARSDIYSLGCLMYHALTGKPPFDGNNSIDVIRAQLMDMPAPLNQADSEIAVPAQLERIITRCLAKEAEARFESAAEVSQALSEADLKVSPPAYLMEFPRTWTGTICGVTTMFSLMVALAGQNPVISLLALLAMALSTLIAQSYFTYCIFLQKELITKAGFKPRLSPLATIALLWLAPIASVGLHGIFGKLDMPLWISAGLCFTGAIAMVCYSLADFHTFIAQRKGRTKVPYVMLLIMLVSASFIVPIAAFFYMQLDAYSFLLRVTLIALGGSLSFLMLWMVNCALRSAANPDYTPVIAKGKLVGAMIATLLATSLIVSQNVFWATDEKIQEAYREHFIAANREKPEQETQEAKAMSLESVLSRWKTRSNAQHQLDYSTEEGLGWISMDLMKFAEAEAAFDRAIKLNPCEPYSLLGGISNAILSNKNDKARSIALKGLDTCSPTTWPAPVFKFFAGKISRQEMFDAIPPLVPGFEAEARFYSGIDYLRENNRAEALKEFQKVIDSKCTEYSEYTAARSLLAKDRKAKP